MTDACLCFRIFNDLHPFTTNASVCKYTIQTYIHNAILVETLLTVYFLLIDSLYPGPPAGSDKRVIFSGGCCPEQASLCASSSAIGLYVNTFRHRSIVIINDYKLIGVK